jgi:hypothetical protein
MINASSEKDAADYVAGLTGLSAGSISLGNVSGRLLTRDPSTRR